VDSEKRDGLRFALHVPNLADPGELVEMGVIAEESGWDGF
jgi:hypothetical protein